MMRRLLHLTKVADTLGSLGIHMSRVNRRNSTDFGYPRRLKIEPIIRSDLYRRSLELHQVQVQLDQVQPYINIGI